MAYFYVKSGGTATGDAGRATSLRTGSFASMGASAYYATLAAARGATTAPQSGDMILVSDASSESSSSGIELRAEDTTVFVQRTMIISVDDSNADQYKRATSAQMYVTGGSEDIKLYAGTHYGLYLKTDDEIRGPDANNRNYFYQCTFETTSNSDRCYNQPQNGSSALFVDCEFKSSSSTDYPIVLRGGTKAKLVNCSFDGGWTVFLEGGGTAGGLSLEVIGCDLSSFTSYIINNLGGAAGSDDHLDFTFRGCKLNASATLVDEEFVGFDHTAKFFNCGTTSANSEYQFYIQTAGGYVEEQDDTGIHRDETTAFPSGEKISAFVQTNSNASVANPFRFELPARYSALSSGSTDTIRIYLAVDNAITLTDQDVWVEASYADGTNNHEYNIVRTFGQKSTNTDDPLETATTLDTDSSSTWKNGASDLTGYNEYYIDIDTSVDVGADCVPEITIYVSRASTALYIDPVFDLVA